MTGRGDVLRQRLHTLIRRLRRDETGNIIVMFALMLPVLAGFIGLGMDVGGWYADKRRIQNAADAGALAGAFEISLGNSSINSRVTTAASNSGYNAGIGGITINNPPGSGSYTGDSSAVEVTITEPAKTYMAHLLVKDLAFDITARAVANQGSAGEACVLALDTTGAAVEVGGNGDVNIDNCQVASNSEDSDSLTVSGSGDLVTDCYSTAGGVSDNGNLATDAGCNGQTNATPIDDPYAHLEAPDDSPEADCDTGGYTHNSTSSVSLPASGNGSYSDPYVICGDLWVKKGTVDLPAGLYIIDGGDLKVGSSGTLTGNDVTIVLKNDAQLSNWNGQGTVNLAAPTDSSVTAADGSTAGDWKGIAIYQDRDTNPTCTGNNCNLINGSSTTTIQGTVYFPNQEIHVNGSNQSGSNCLQVVAMRVGFNGSGSLYSDNDDCPTAGVTPIDIPGPVELVE